MGIIKSTVLSAKNGVITEERFQKMTTIQWLFHYYEVLKDKKERDEIIDIILTHLKLVGTMANPQSGKKLKEIEDLRNSRTEIKAEDFAGEFEKIKKSIPQTIEVKAVKGTGAKSSLPVFKRETLGIKINQEGGE